MALYVTFSKKRVMGKMVGKLFQKLHLRQCYFPFILFFFWIKWKLKHQTSRLYGNTSTSVLQHNWMLYRIVSELILGPSYFTHFMHKVPCVKALSNCLPLRTSPRLKTMRIPGQGSCGLFWFCGAYFPFNPNANSSLIFKKITKKNHFDV